ncbi:MAG: hemerythrin-like metal-binding protein [Magnetococcales bacterium]|nr:hemerythrin-like metal-binding protein [Magnetococcales bacterium]HIJ83461.1 hypothetical protein [Magnetococcales bacterium]
MIEQENYMPEKFRIGHPAIDVQHEVLFVFYHELMLSLQNADDSYHLSDIFLGLGSYVLNHFKFEEDAMLATHYEQSAAHCEEHHLLKEKVAEFHNRFVSVKNMKEEHAIAQEIAVFLANWLEHHIAEVDKQLAHHLNQWQ